MGRKIWLAQIPTDAGVLETPCPNADTEAKERKKAISYAAPHVEFQVPGAGSCRQQPDCNRVWRDRLVSIVMLLSTQNLTEITVGRVLKFLHLSWNTSY